MEQNRLEIPPAPGLAAFLVSLTYRHASGRLDVLTLRVNALTKHEAAQKAKAQAGPGWVASRTTWAEVTQ